MENVMDAEQFWNPAFDNIPQPLFQGSCGIYYEEDILQLLQSQNPENAKKLNLLLIEIVSTDNLDAFEFIMLNSHKLEIINEKNQTCIHLAYYAGSWEILTASNLWLPNLSNDMMTCTDTNGLTFLHIACYIANAIFVEKCLSSNLDVEAFFSPGVEQPNHKGFRPLHFASINHNLNTIKVLLKYGANINAVDYKGRTPLHVACYAYCNPNKEGFKEHLDVVKFLLKNQSNPSIKDRYGNTPLLSIFPDNYNKFMSGSYTFTTVPIIETKLKLELLLEQGIDLTIKNINNESILHCIIKNLHHLRLPSNLANISFKDSNHVEMLKKIFDSNPKIEVNGKNSDGQTPLQLAVSYMSIDIVKLLIDHDADVKTVKFTVVKNGHCFYYPFVIPNLESVLNIELIIRLLSQNEYQMTMEDNLNILKFLIHNEKDCDCFEVKSVKDAEMCSTKMINFGLAHHGQKKFAKIISNTGTETNTFLAHMTKYVAIKTKCKFYCSQRFIKFMAVIEKLVEQPFFNGENYKDAYSTDYMKSTNIRDNLTIYDVMIKHPCYVHKYLKDLETYSLILNLTNRYDEDLQEIIKGHLSQSLLRDYAERSAFDSLELLIPFLPGPCLKILVHYLDLESMLNVCSAALIDENFEG